MKATSQAIMHTETISLHPNSTSDFFQIKGILDAALVTISDLNCRVLLSKRVVGDENISIDTFKNGVYVAKIVTSTGIVERKLIKT